MIAEIIEPMKILSLSDILLKSIYSSDLPKLYGDVDFVISCGDLPYYYLEYVVDNLKKPVFFVRGNHDNPLEYSHKGNRTHPWGAVDLHGSILLHQNLLIAGLEGSIRYNKGPFQYSQQEMWALVFRMLPMLIWNTIRHGRALDILVSHSPLWGVKDKPDAAHQGFQALRWLVRTFKPTYHFHGHIHIDPSDPRVTQFHDTQVINSVGALVKELDISG